MSDLMLASSRCSVAAVLKVTYFSKLTSYAQSVKTISVANQSPMKWVPGTLPSGNRQRHADDQSRLSSGALPPVPNSVKLAVTFCV
jgi:hypothetical protein